MKIKTDHESKLMFFGPCPMHGDVSFRDLNPYDYIEDPDTCFCHVLEVRM